MEIVSRAEWGARAPRSITTTTWARRTEFIVHYSGASASQSVRSIQDYCMDHKGYSDIDYNALVNTRGQIFEGRTGIWLTVGSHCLDHNTAGVGVCYIGEQSTPLTVEAKRAIRWLYDEANRRRQAAGVSGVLAPHPHSDFVNTDCPGTSLRAWVRERMPVIPAEKGLEMFCIKGDKGPAVKAMQLMVMRVGGSVGSSGADGDYGTGTAAGLAKIIGGNGEVYGPDQYVALHAKAFAGIQGPPGRPGKDGLPGEPGAPGRTPTRVSITGVISDYE